MAKTYAMTTIWVGNDHPPTITLRRDGSTSIDFGEGFHVWFREEHKVAQMRALRDSLDEALRVLDPQGEAAEPEDVSSLAAANKDTPPLSAFDTHARYLLETGATVRDPSGRHFRFLDGAVIQVGHD